MHNLLVSIASEETPRLAGQSHTDRMKAILAKVAAWKADPAEMVRHVRELNDRNTKRQRDVLKTTVRHVAQAVRTPWALGLALWPF